LIEKDPRTALWSYSYGVASIMSGRSRARGLWAQAYSAAELILAASRGQRSATKSIRSSFVWPQQAGV
jgi:hypothetical protein